MEKEKVYCPDCGCELISYIIKQLAPPYERCISWHCCGKCCDNYAQAEGISADRLPYGIPKLSLSVVCQ